MDAVVGPDDRRRTSQRCQGARLDWARSGRYYRPVPWMNCGGQIPHERVLASMRRFAERVVPRMS